MGALWVAALCVMSSCVLKHHKRINLPTIRTEGKLDFLLGQAQGFSVSVKDVHFNPSYVENKLKNQNICFDRVREKMLNAKLHYKDVQLDSMIVKCSTCMKWAQSVIKAGPWGSQASW